MPKLTVERAVLTQKFPGKNGVTYAQLISETDAFKISTGEGQTFDDVPAMVPHDWEMDINGRLFGSNQALIVKNKKLTPCK